MVNRLFPPAFFVTGTDTEIGKTFVSAMLTVGLGAGYWKPIRTGMPYTDTDWVRDNTGLSSNHFFRETYLFAPHISPHQAAKEANVTIDLAKVIMPEYHPLPHLIVEGAGGIMVPINNNETILDVIVHLQLPVLVIARSGLGTINHTVLTVDKLRQYSVPIIGVVMNGPKHATNRRDIEHYANVPVLAEIEPVSLINPDTLKAAFHQYFGDNNSNAFTSDELTNMASFHTS